MLKISNHEKEFVIPISSINGVMQNPDSMQIMILTDKGCTIIPFLSSEECSDAVEEIHSQIFQYYNSIK